MRHIAFRDVEPGTRFRTPRRKRLLGGVKIIPVEIMGEVRIRTRNAVILTDHVGERAHDAGTLTYLKDSEIVEVE